jgi:carbonic anhydrase/acetyltransferase-like protein (isoleucine patch superfamily)
MPIYRLGDHAPQIANNAFVAPEATLIGDVAIGERATIWFGAVIRGDNEPIRVGADTSVQECAALHTDMGFPLNIGAGVTVGHQAVLHGCTVGEGSLIGIQAVVMNGAVIGRQCLVGAGAIVTEGKQFPDRSLILGAPAKVVRQLTDQDIAKLANSAADYVARGERYRAQLQRLPEGKMEHSQQRDVQKK